MDNSLKMIENLKTATSRLKEEIGKVIIGQERIIDNVLTALFANGHVLIEGVPEIGRASCRERV